MKQKAFSKVLAVVACVLMLCGLAPTLGGADTAQYFYDPLGRLIAVVDGQGSIAAYQYDRVGNLLSISRSTASPPTITSVSPNQLTAGDSALLMVGGTGFDFASIVSDHPEIVFGIPSVTATGIAVPVTLPNPTQFGTTTLTISSAGGIASTTVDVRQPTPTIQTMAPDHGLVNTTVVIQGTGFGTKPGSNLVTFPGLLGPRIVATVVSESATTITVRSPFGATSGLVTVKVGTLVSNGVLSFFDSVGPVVTSILPFDSQAAVSLNTQITATFDEQVDPATVTYDTFFVGAPLVTRLPGTISVAPDQRSITFLPAQPLTASTQHTVTIGTGFGTFLKDINGNPIAGAVGANFTTGTALDTTGPTIANVSPAMGALNVSTNAVIRIQFNEIVHPPSVTDLNILLQVGGVPVPVIRSSEQNFTVIRLQLPGGALLQSNTAYQLTVTTGLLDQSGNPLSAPFTSTFTTGAGTDGIPPTVTSVNPPDGAGDIAVTPSIIVTFSEPIAPASINTTNTFILTGGGFTGNIPGSFSVSTDHQMVTFTPSAPLFAGQTYILTLSGIEDTSGNRLAAFSSSFTTLADSGGGVVPASAFVFATPNALFANGQTITRVTIDSIADANGFLVPDGTRVAVTAAAAFQQTSAGGTILGGTTSTADPRFTVFTTANGRVRFDYQSPALVLAPGFSASSVIQVANLTPAGIPSNLIGISPITLVTSQTATFSFNPPTLLPNGTSQAEITVLVRDPINTLDDFGRPIPAGTVVGVGVLSPQGLLGTINGGAVAPDPRYKLFSLKTGGLVDLTYTAPNLVQGPTDGNSDMFSLVSVDPAGNLLGTVGFSSIGLVTGGCVGNECIPGGFTGPLPKILALSPGPGESNVGTTAPIMAQFSQSIAPASVTPLTFAVSSGGTPILGTYALSAGPNGPNTIVTFTPTAPWTAGTAVDVTLTTGIKNIAGNPLLSSAFNSFSIDVGPDATGPSVVRASLGNGLTNVPHSTVINIQFNQPVNALSLNSNNFTVSAGGTPISGRISLSNGELGVNTIATFIQDQLLASDTLYTITVGAGVTDSSGNGLTPGFTSTFRTAAGTPLTDIGQPSVDSFSPPNGQQEVPLNPIVTVRTDKAINPITLNSGSFGVSSNQGSVEGTLVVVPDQKNWTFVPTAPLVPTTNYSLEVTNGLRDIAGNRLSGGVGSSFTTGTALANPAGPQISSVTPQNNATNVFLNQPITIRFLEPLAATTITNQTIFVTRGGTPVNGVLTLLENNRAVRWVPVNSGTLAASALHTMTITTGVTGLANNPIATPVTSTFTTGTATDTTAPAVSSFDPVNGAQNVPRNQQIQVTFNEPIDPASAQTGLELVHSDSGTPIAGALTLSPDRTILQFAPTFPLFSGQTFDIFLNGITDSVGNQMAFASSTFATAMAPGTVISNVPDSATVSSSPTNLTANGQQTSVITITSIRRGGIPVPDGTLIGVTTAPAFNGNSFPGTLLGGVPSGADARFVLYSVVGGAVTLTYQTPSLPSGTNLESWVQVVGVDAAGAPMNLIGQRRLRLFGTGGGQ